MSIHRLADDVVDLRGDKTRTLARNRELFERQTVAEATLDEAQAAFDIAVADVAVARAALRTAELDLSYTRITAPITGQIGRALFTQGNLVGRADADRVRPRAAVRISVSRRAVAV